MSAAHYFSVLGILMQLYFGFRVVVRGLQFLIRLDMRLRKNRPADPLIDWITDINLRDTVALDVVGLGVGIATTFIPMAFF
jgi:hypothetical protein